LPSGGRRTPAHAGARRADATPPSLQEIDMTWSKPEFEVVEVTMEVTAYVARR
jgi:coenzyme PQQ precursor peptide PqqA